MLVSKIEIINDAKERALPDYSLKGSPMWMTLTP